MRKISAKEFAKAVNISEPMVYKYYKMDNIDINTIEKWCNFLNLPLLFFIDNDIYDDVMNSEVGKPFYYTFTSGGDSIKMLKPIIYEDKQYLKYDLSNIDEENIKKSMSVISEYIVSTLTVIENLKTKIKQLEDENSKLKENK